MEGIKMLIRTSSLGTLDKIRLWSVLPVLCLCACSTAASGAQVHENEEFGIRAGFPSGSLVCQSRSGDHPVGFYSWIGRPTDCERGMMDAGERSIGVYGAYNSGFARSPEGELPCRHGSVPSGITIDLTILSIPGQRAASCAIRQENGLVRIVVATQDGTWSAGDNSPEFKTPKINYAATLITHPDNIQEDLTTFRDFLARLVIEPDGVE